ncbi:MAG: hypothetical protein ACKO2N_22385 [Tabrizicola sp.]
MFRPLALIVLALATMILSPSPQASAQETRAWVQVEAHPDLATALDRARAYAALFPETSAFRLSSGWYGIALGPYPADEAPIRLGALKREGQIPSDSFIDDGARYGEQIFPEDGTAAPAPDLAEDVAAVVETPQPDPAELPDEDRQQARDSEALLTP